MEFTSTPRIIVYTTFYYHKIISITILKNKNLKENKGVASRDWRIQMFCCLY